MTRRIEVELTSSRDDGTWTWRAAGAKQPKGDLPGSLLYPDAKVGDVVRADADFDIDGIVIVAVLAPKGDRKEPELLEILGSGREEQLVTTTLAPKGKGRRKGRDRGFDDDDDRGGRGGRSGGRGRDGGGDRNRSGGGGGRGGDRPRSAPPRDAKPKPKRLRPGKEHRSAWVASLPPEQQPIAEQLVRGGLPQVRQAIEAQSEQAVKEGQPPIAPEPLLAVAEQLLSGHRTAEWRDRAESAMADVDELDLRDLRSVVVAAETGARDDETRALADALRTALAARVDREHAAWLTELAETLAEGRTVRALRISSRPVKAGAPLPADLSARLIEGAAASLTSDTMSDRWGTVLDALAYSPVRQAVKPQGIPKEPDDKLKALVTKLSTRVPDIAALFGIEPTAPPRKKRARKRKPSGGAKNSKAETTTNADTPGNDPAAEQAQPSAETASPAPDAQNDTPPADATPSAEAEAPAADPTPAEEPAAPAADATPSEEPPAAPEEPAAPAEESAPPAAEASGSDEPPAPSEKPAKPAEEPATEVSASADPAPSEAATSDASPTADTATPEPGTD